MTSSDYIWQPTLSDFRTKGMKKKIDYAGVRFLLNGVKGMIKRESDPEVRKELTKAGMHLNSILFK